MSRPLLLPACLLVACLLAPVAGAHAQGVVIGPDDRPAALVLRTHRVEAQVQEQVAVVTVEHVFHNPGRQTVEGTFLFPLPPEAQVSRFSMTVDGREMTGELLAADEARAIYESIVRRSLDPALLEMADYRTFRARVFPIPGGATRTITLRYDATLRRDGSLVTFQYPFQGRLATRPAGVPQPRITPVAPGEQPAETSTQHRLQLTLATGTALKNIYSPSHEVAVERPDDRHAAVTLTQEAGVDGRDFILYYSLDPGEIGATLLAHRPYSDRPGYFTLLLSPRVDDAARRVQPRDVVFVLDTSGSMAGDKIEQAREALRYCLSRLGDHDRFGLVAFSSDVDAFRETLLPATARADARYFVDQLEAGGGTNINAALLRAVAMLHERDHHEAPGMIVFLTDGLPSTGETDEGAIRRNVAAANTQGVRLFSFGVGYDVNTRLLDGLSQSAQAFADYISPDENIETRVAAFYDKVRFPLMTDLRFEVDGADAYAFAPAHLTDLYKGGQVILTGRYRRPGPARLTLTGRIDGRTETMTYDLDFPTAERERDFVARLWATRRVGQLLDEIRLNGEQAALKEEVIDLAKAFGLVTPYTSYLVQEEELAGVPLPNRATAPRGQAGAARAAMAPAASAAADAAVSRSTGFEAVQMSKSIRAMREAATAPTPAETGVVTLVGRTLRQDPTLGWVDLAYVPEQHEVLQVRFASDAYFTLLRAYPEAHAFARLGDRVLFQLRGRFIQVGDTGRETMTAEAWQTFFGS